jgi:Lon protease-like protein
VAKRMKVLKIGGLYAHLDHPDRVGILMRIGPRFSIVENQQTKKRYRIPTDKLRWPSHARLKQKRETDKATELERQRKLRIDKARRARLARLEATRTGLSTARPRVG